MTFLVRQSVKTYKATFLIFLLFFKERFEDWYKIELMSPIKLEIFWEIYSLDRYEYNDLILEVVLSIEFGKIINNSNLINYVARIGEDRTVKVGCLLTYPKRKLWLTVDPIMVIVLTLAKYWTTVAMTVQLMYRHSLIWW